MKLIAFLCLLCSSAPAAVVLEWYPNPETNILGYRLYWGAQPRYYDNIFDVGNVTNFVLAASTGRVYYAVTAYNTELLESEYSDEVFWEWPIIPLPPSRPMNLHISGTNNVAAIRLQQNPTVTGVWQDTGIAFVPLTNQSSFFRAVVPLSANAAPKRAAGSRVGALDRMRLLMPRP